MRKIRLAANILSLGIIFNSVAVYATDNVPEVAPVAVSTESTQPEVVAPADTTDTSAPADIQSSLDISEDTVFIGAIIVPKENSDSVAYVYTNKATYADASGKVKAAKVEDTGSDGGEKIITINITELDTSENIDTKMPYDVSADFDDSKIKDTAEYIVSESTFNTAPAVIANKDKVYNALNGSSVEDRISVEPDISLDDKTYDSTSPIIGQKAKDVFWDVTKSENKRTSFNFMVEENIPVKLEIFYTAGANYPQISMLSPNKQLYTNKANTLSDDIKIITRHNIPMQGYSDIVYDTLYILTSNPKAAGKWEIAYTIGNDIKDTILCNCNVDDKWETLAVEYKTPVKFFVLWWFDDTSSVYRPNDLVSIVAAEESPAANYIEPATPEEKPEKDRVVPLLILILVLMAGTIALSVYVYKKLKEEHKNQKLYAVKKANRKFRLRRQKENEMLENVLSKYDKDYIEDPAPETETKEPEVKEKKLFKTKKKEESAESAKSDVKPEIKDEKNINADTSDKKSNILDKKNKESTEKKVVSKPVTEQVSPQVNNPQAVAQANPQVAMQMPQQMQQVPPNMIPVGQPANGYGYPVYQQFVPVMPINGNFVQNSDASQFNGIPYVVNPYQQNGQNIVTEEVKKEDQPKKKSKEALIRQAQKEKEEAKAKEAQKTDKKEEIPPTWMQKKPKKDANTFF